MTLSDDFPVACAFLGCTEIGEMLVQGDEGDADMYCLRHAKDMLSTGKYVEVREEDMDD